MRIEFLGTGGAVPTPRPGCRCRVCVQARREGVPYARTGPSLFVHGPDLLVDTPEESRLQLDRSTVGRVAACVYSHWHPDHVMGRRVFETMNLGLPARAPRATTDVYLPERVAADFRTWLAGWEHLAFLERHRLVRVVVVPDGEAIELAGGRVLPFPLAEEFVYAFLVEADGRRALLVPDELRGWRPPDWLPPVDLAVLPMGIAATSPLTGEPIFPPGHPLLRVEATFDETLEVVRALDARQVVLTHVEEFCGLTHDDLLEVEQRLAAGGLAVRFAHDTLVVAV